MLGLDEGHRQEAGLARCKIPWDVSRPMGTKDWPGLSPPKFQPQFLDHIPISRMKVLSILEKCGKAPQASNEVQIDFLWIRFLELNVASKTLASQIHAKAINLARVAQYG